MKKSSGNCLTLALIMAASSPCLGRSLPCGDSGQKLVFTAVFGTAYGQSTQAAPAAGSLQINVRVYNYADVAPSALKRAEEETSRIFQKAGVRLAWLDCPKSHKEEERYPACAPPLGSMAVDMRILSSFMEARLRSTGEELGSALPLEQATSGSAAWVYYGRVERLAESHVAECDQILGHVMAHEIGHVLLGPDSHSQNGIMRANWDRKYLEEASRGQLFFTREQARRICAGVEARTARAESYQMH